MRTAPQPGSEDPASRPCCGARAVADSAEDALFMTTGDDEPRGIPASATIKLTGDDGWERRFDLARDDGPLVRVRTLVEGETAIFQTCPICLSGQPDTREHVPQRDLGGRVVTRTCSRCNNELGSRVEVALKDWFDHALRSVRFSGGDVPGVRRSPRLLLRWSPEGEFILFPESESDSTFQEMLKSGSVLMQYSPPEPRLWQAAALKHAYLAACVCLRQIPMTPLADQVRAELLAVRDATRGHEPFGEIAAGLRLSRSYAPASGPAVSLVALRSDGGEIVDVGLSLAGTLFVSWPLEPLQFTTP